MSILVDSLALSGSCMVLLGSAIQAIQAFIAFIASLRTSNSSDNSDVFVILHPHDKLKFITLFIGWLLIMVGAALTVVALALTLVSAK
jgi:hypothetical protein